MTQEEFNKAPLLDQILYDTTGMLVENHPSIAEAMDKYHQAKLKLLGIADVRGSLPSDDRIVAEAIQAARKVNTEVGLLPNNNDIRMFCLGAKWMRDFTHSNDR